MARHDCAEAPRIEARIRELSRDLCSEWVNPDEITRKVLEGLHDGISASGSDIYAAETCAYMSQRHPDFSVLAGRLLVTRLHEETSDSFVETCRSLREHCDERGGHGPMLSDEFWTFVSVNGAELDRAIRYDRDFLYDYFALKTLQRSYLMQLHGRVVERPQHLLMRVACGVHSGDLEAALETYDLMSRHVFVHASPTLFNAGTCRPQLASCFLVRLSGEDMASIFETLRQCAVISSAAGGLGIAISDLPAAGPAPGYVSTKGIVPVLRVFNETAQLAEQGNGQRRGAFAVYLEPWHADVFHFMELRKNHGPEERRTRNLFLGLWIPDLFMRRVEEDADWTLFCPLEARDTAKGKGLADLWGEEFEILYNRLEVAGHGRQTVRARQLWFHILNAQVETGMPYMLYKDSVNRKSNQQNLGMIRCSNLCTEIVEFTSAEEVAVCNLASISLPAFVRDNSGIDGEAARKSFDLDAFHRTVKIVVRNLDHIIDGSFYPVEGARLSNLQHRPLGVGVQGLADALQELRLPFDGEGARRLNLEVFEALYHAACEASCELAARSGPYASFAGSPASRGQLQFDLWGVQPSSGRWDWAGLKERIAHHGLRNSLLVAPMPTAGTAALLGNTESFEPRLQNLYVRRVLSGEFVQLNRHLVRDLFERGLWSEDMRQRLIVQGGSVQELEEVPQDLKDLYKTAWEIRQRCIVDMAADRGPFVDQSQSLSIFMSNPTPPKLTSMHFHGWKRGLKTGMYYLRTRPAVDAVKVTVDPQYLQGAGGRPPEQQGAANTEGPAVRGPLSESPPVYDCISCSG